MFSKQLINYTESHFKESKIEILTKTMVKEVKEKSVVLQMPDKSIVEVPCGMVVWAAGNKGRKITQDLMAKLPQDQTNRRGITVDGMQHVLIPFHFLMQTYRIDFMQMKGANGIFAIGDCTATSYAPTAQVASQQGAYLARVLHQMARRDILQARLATLEKVQIGLPPAVSTDAAEAVAAAGADAKKIENEKEDLKKQLAKFKPRPFHYSHQGTLAYIGSEKAIADLPFMNNNVSDGVCFFVQSFNVCLRGNIF